MEFSTDLKALIRSHQATDHFDRAEEISFDPDAKGFSAANAWWLAELSRWMYVGKRLPVNQRHFPQQILKKVNLEEQSFCSAHGIHASLISAKDQTFSILVFRGTSQFKNWLTHINVAPLINDAHRGYEKALDAIWPDLGPKLQKVKGKLFYTGHSMGGALAALSARRHEPTAVYTYGAPPIANRLLAEQYSRNFSVYRLVNYRDVVSKVPLASSHLGELHYLSHDHSLNIAPDQGELLLDQRRGPRKVMRKLNRKKLLHLPERLCDHSPQNYVANLERVSLGS